MTKSKETVAGTPIAAIVKTILSDGSYVYDVQVGMASGPCVTLLAGSEHGAQAIFDAINQHAVGVE